MAHCTGYRMQGETGMTYCDAPPRAAYTWDGVPFNYKGKPGAAVCSGHEAQLQKDAAKYPGLELVERIGQEKPRWVKDDGGRAAAGFKGDAGDCVTRAIAIATGRPYKEVYDALGAMSKKRRLKRDRHSSARDGVARQVYDRYIESVGGVWTPLMNIGSGCKVHLRREELPAGRIIVRVSRHLVAVIDGVIHDTHDPSRGGTRCVYGYWTFPGGA